MIYTRRGNTINKSPIIIILIAIIGLASLSSANAITIPSNILYYLPINVINQNSIPVSANTPIAIGTTAPSFNSGNIIGFNALAYSQYYTCNLNNAEFFYANGTIIPSWLEGNILNETGCKLCLHLILDHPMRW